MMQVTKVLRIKPSSILHSLILKVYLSFKDTMKRNIALQPLPVLSAQLMTAPTGRPREMRNFAPDEPPRPKGDKAELVNENNIRTLQKYLKRKRMYKVSHD
ncbi:hypothetical protein XELAEV_18004271mg [Xenopus laevis]|uniref:Uncharacterized protein n=1 Tax=Xenopus laevis TaxID=8355 RepID=A0A974BPM1_XENLA|nr:hypothetical protein XELAEV_18004271mg [Xenopus laevis]